jgi:hypothetical protein
MGGQISRAHRCSHNDYDDTALITIRHRHVINRIDTTSALRVKLSSVFDFEAKSVNVFPCFVVRTVSCQQYVVWVNVAKVTTRTIKRTRTSDHARSITIVVVRGEP